MQTGLSLATEVVIEVIEAATVTTTDSRKEAVVTIEITLSNRLVLSLAAGHPSSLHLSLRRTLLSRSQ